MAIIYTYPVKTTPAADDLILISDSADSNKTKQVKVSSLPSSGAGITLTTTGTSGAATLVGTVLNIPNYATTGGTPDSPVNSVQFNEAGAFGGSGDFKYDDSTKVLTIGDQDVNRGVISIAGGGSGAGELRLGDPGTSGGTVTLKGGNDHAVSYTIKLPDDSPSANNKILESDASGNLTWINTPASTAPQGDDGQYQYKNGSSFAGADNLRFDSDKIHIGKDGNTPTRGQLVMYGDGTNASDIKLYNSTNNRSVTLAQQAGATQDLTLTFPGQASGGNNKILESDSSGQLSWIDTPTAGAVSTYTNAVNNYILTSSGAGSINGESSLIYNGSILTLATSKVFNASRSTVTSGVAAAPIYVTNSTTSSGAPTNFASNVAGGNGSRHIEFYHGGTAVGSITSSSTNIIINGESSDERKKKNIVDWTENVLDKFALIEPKKFNFTHQDDSDPLIKGFIAQQMVDKFPEAYNHDYSISDTEGYYSFNAMGMNVYLMKAIKELKEEIDSLKSRISTLEG